MSAHGRRAEAASEAGRHAVAWLVWFGLLFALWLALVDNTPLDDMVNGLVCAAIGATVAQIVDAQRLVRVRMSPRWLPRLWRPLWRLVADTAIVTVALFRALVLRRQVRGRFRLVPFRAGGHDPSDAGRRAATEWTGSLTPNRYVIGIDEDSMLLHELVPSEEPLDPLGLG